MSGIIYLITCNKTGEQYVGSTTIGLNQRMRNHRSNMKRFDEDIRRSSCASFDIIRRGNFTTQTLEAVNFGNDKSDLKKREEFYISQYNACNIIKHPGKSKLEYNQHYFQTEKGKQVKCVSNQKYREKMGEELLAKKREYYRANKGAIAEKSKLYREANKEVIALKKQEAYYNNIDEEHEKRKAYRLANKEKIAESNKAYYEKNKERIALRDKAKRDARKTQLIS